MLKIGIIDYVNALPLIGAIKQKVIAHSHELIFNVPSHLNDLLNRGEIDLGLVSSTEFLDSSDYSLFSTLGIAAHGPIFSVNLYIKGHLKDLDKAAIGVTHHSATSVALLKVLAQHYWKINPHYQTLNRDLSYENYEGFLLIGDEALQRMEIPGFTRIDLAEAWYYATGLPFVFAVFAVRKESIEKHSKALEDFHNQLSESYAWGKTNPEQIISQAQEKCGLSSSVIEKYYSRCHYDITSKELESLYKFAALKNSLSSKHT